MIQPTSLNLIIVGLMVVIFTFLWRMAAGFVLTRNPESNFGKAMGAVLS